MNEQQLDDRLGAIENQLAEVLFIINSNHKTNSKGLAETVEDLKSEVRELQSWKTEINTKIVTYSAVVGVLLGAIFWIGDKLISIFSDK